MIHEKRGTLQLIGVAFLLICVLMLIFALPSFLRQWHVLRTWPTADAQIIRSDVVVDRISQHEQMYSARLGILYTVAGRPITTELISFQDRDYQKTRSRADEYSVGSHHEIRYDPDHPTQARIGAGWNRRFFALPLIVFSVAAIFGVGAAILFWTASRVRV